MSRFFRIWYLVFSVIGLLFSMQTLAQTERFVNYGTTQGLSQSSVNAITQDNEGFIWIATDDGLNRFDGLNFTIFKNQANNINSLSNNFINDLWVDKTGLIWIATNKGINTYNPVNKQFTRYFLNLSNYKSDLNKISHFCYDNNRKGFWLATGRSGFVFFDPKNNNLEEYHFIIGDTIVETQATNFLNAGDFLWITTNKYGLFRFNKATKQIRNYTFDTTDTSVDFSIATPNAFNSIFYDSIHKLYLIGTQGNGVATFNPTTKKIRRLHIEGLSNPILRVKKMVAIDNKLWIATYSGLLWLHRNTYSFGSLLQNNPDNDRSLASNKLLSLFKDNTNNLWVGTYDNGLSLLAPSRYKFNHFSKPYISKIQSLGFLSNDSILIGTMGQGTFLWDRKHNTTTALDTAVNPLVHKTALSIYFDRVHRILWLGTWGGGLQRINLIDHSVKTYKIDNSKIGSNTILKISAFGKYLWLGTWGNGLIKFDPATETFVAYKKGSGLSSDIVYSITKGNGDTLWIGTEDGGVNVFSTSTFKSKAYNSNINDSVSISSNLINYVYDDGENTVWVATSNGLNRFNKKTHIFNTYFMSDGLPNDYIYSILPEGDSALWMSTNKGLSRALLDKQKNILHFTNYSYDDGLQSDEFNQGASLILSNGEMFFGGVNGFNYFYPNQIPINTHKPPTLITSFSKFGKEVTLDTAIAFKKKIVLSYKENFVEFGLVALDFVYPEKNKFSWKMEGLGNSNWSVPSYHNFISFPNLPPGEYVFMVRAANNDNIWNDKGVRLTIIVTPPIYKRTSAQVVFVLLILLIIYLFFRYRTRRIEHEKKILEQKVAERTEELQEKNNDIMSSIQYAQRIQQAILPNVESFSNIFADSFVLYRPKDIVSGDFFWFTQKGNTTYFAVADCTGHGVPGAFMSIIGNNLLSNIVAEKENPKPAEILNQLNIDIRIALKQQSSDSGNFDGMDLILCALTENTLEFSGAYRPLLLIRNGELEEHRVNRFSIGGKTPLEKTIFTNHQIEIKKNDVIYLFSDGYPDQFGYKSNKKLMMGRFKKILLETHSAPMNEQKRYIENYLIEWMGDLEQIDDILVMGIRF